MLGLSRKAHPEHLAVSELKMEEDMAADNVWRFRKSKPPGSQQHFKDAIEDMDNEQGETFGDRIADIPKPDMADMPNPDGHRLPPSMMHWLAAQQNIAAELMRFKDAENPLAAMQKVAEAAFDLVMIELKLPGTIRTEHDSKLEEVLRQQQQLNTKFNTLMEREQPPLS